MKNFTKLFALAVIVLGFSATSFGQIVPLTTKATITSVAAVTGEVYLNFGSIGAGTAGTVVVGTNNDRSASTSSMLLPGIAGTSGFFTVNGSIGNIVNLAMPAADVILKNGLGGVNKEMTIASGTWHFNIAGGTDDLNDYTMLLSTAAVKVGATLTVSATQAIGEYTGSYPITIVLN